MDPLGTNKILAAFLGAALVFMMIRMLPEIFMHNEGPEVPAYIVGELEAGAEEEEVELPFPQAEWVAAMDPERGARVFKNCTSCHNAEEGGPNGTGPGLWGVVGAQKGVHPGFDYSDAMASAGTVWGYEELDGFLEKPKSYLPGTKMNFVGIRNASDRAAVIEYLRLASADPLPRPEPAGPLVELTAEAEDAAVPGDQTIGEDPTLELTGNDEDVVDEVVDTEAEETVSEETAEESESEE